MGRIVLAGRWLALPVCLLLFLQWPLRDLIGGYSREANDLAQWIFALYVCLGVTHATRERVHLSAAGLAHRFGPELRDRIGRIATLIFILPWAAFVAVVAFPTALRSLLLLEGFPDTYNPGYFVIKLSVCFLALIALLQALVDMLRPARRI